MESFRIFLLYLFLIQNMCYAQLPARYNAIASGIPWYDQNGNIVSAHGANILKENGRYYLFGEAHTDTSNAFNGFNCYSSSDLYNWNFERVALPIQQDGKLGAKRVGERVKVMKCPSTGEFLMYMHVDTLGYKDPFVGYATSMSITGPYLFKGPLLFNGDPIRKWDMGTFQDFDGSGYLLIHGGEIYKLTEDFKGVSELVNATMAQGFESPTLFRRGDTYYFLGSHLTSWEKNDNYYYTSTSLQGPWKPRGTFAPQGKLTWNSQCTFVLTINGSRDTTFVFMGDRWSYPKQASAATYVWQPLDFKRDSLSIPTFEEAWQINLSTGKVKKSAITGETLSHSDRRIKYAGNWQPATRDDSSMRVSDKPGDSFSIDFTGEQIALYAHAGPKGGYAHVAILDSQQQLVHASTVDMYCKYPETSLKFLSPTLRADNYVLKVSVIGERPNWSDKRKSDYGSTGYEVSINKIVIKK